MSVSLVIAFLGGLILLAHLSNGLFKFTKIPSVLILILLGIFLGPIIGIVDKGDFGEVGAVFSSITLFLILFESGTDLKFGILGRAITSSLMITLFNFLVSVALGFLGAYVFAGLNVLQSLFFGVIIGGTSSAIVIPIVKQLGLGEKAGTVLLLESALSDVLCLVIGLALLVNLNAGADSLDVGAIANTIGKSFSIAALIGAICGVVWSVALKWVRNIPNSKFITLAVVFIVYGIVDDGEFGLGYNGSIAAMTFGIMLGNAEIFGRSFLKSMVPAKELTQDERNFNSEIVFILQTFFFVYAGVSISFGNPLTYLIGLGIVLGILLIRPISIKLFTSSKQQMLDYSAMSVLAPKGLVPIILAAMVAAQIQDEALSQIISDLAISVVLFSIIICSLMIIVLSKNPGIGFYQGLFSSKVAAPVEMETASEVEGQEGMGQDEGSVPNNEGNTGEGQGTDGTEVNPNQ